MLMFSLLLASTPKPIMSGEQIYHAANDYFGLSFNSFQEMEQANPVIFSELANSMYDPHKIAFLKILAAKKGCVESQAYLEALLTKKIDYSVADEEERKLIEEIAQRIIEIRKKKPIRPR